MKREELQALIVEFQELNQTMQQLEKQQGLLQNQMLELMLARQNIDEMQKVKKGTEILVPISSGVYAKANINETDEFIINIGAEVTVPKSAALTKEMLLAQVEEIQKMQQALSSEMEENTMKAAKMEQKIRDLAR